MVLLSPPPRPFYPRYEASKLDIAGSQHRVGLLSGVSNTIAALAGVVGVPLTATVVATYGVQGVFLLLAGVYFAACAVYATYGTAARIL